jgi:peroxiredoxin
VQVPGYIEKANEFRELGVEEVIIWCVNDGAVMDAWGKDQEISKADGLITFMGDPAAELTDKLGIQLSHAGPASVGIIGRSKRTAMYCENGMVKIFNIAEGPNDPAGDDKPDVTLADQMLKEIKALKEPPVKKAKTDL